MKKRIVSDRPSTSTSQSSTEQKRRKEWEEEKKQRQAVEERRKRREQKIVDLMLQNFDLAPCIGRLLIKDVPPDDYREVVELAASLKFVNVKHGMPGLDEATLLHCGDLEFRTYIFYGEWAARQEFGECYNLCSYVIHPSPERTLRQSLRLLYEKEANRFPELVLGCIATLILEKGRWRSITLYRPTPGLLTEVSSAI